MVSKLYLCLRDEEFNSVSQKRKEAQICSTIWLWVSSVRAMGRILRLPSVILCNLLTLLAWLRSVSLFHTTLVSKTPVFCSWLFQHFVLLSDQASSYFTSVYPLPYSFSLSVRGSVFIAVFLPSLIRYWSPFLSFHIHPT